MEEIVSFFHYLLNSEEIIQTGGLIAILIIVYLENGVFFGFFLPGDYLLFLTGVFVASKHLDHPISLVIFGIFVAAFLGAFTGYISGKYFGDRIRNRKDSVFFKKKYLNKTATYFDRYGSQTLVIARFLPVIRTFAPILAGLVNMNILKFLLFNIIGGAIWSLVLVGGGYYLGTHFPVIIEYVHFIIIFFLLITTVTVIKGFMNAKKEMEDTAEE